jgi:hypothetical protein
LAVDWLVSSLKFKQKSKIVKKQITKSNKNSVTARYFIHLLELIINTVEIKKTLYKKVSKQRKAGGKPLRKLFKSSK